MRGRRRARAAAERLLVEGVLALGERRPGLAALAAGPLDAAHLLAIAGRHAVAEALHLALEDHGAASAMPPDVRATLRDAHELAAARNTVLLAEATRVLGALRDAGIRAALLKGTALLAAHLRAIGARHVGDIDVLVDPGELDRAAEVARALGCRRIGPDPLHLDGRRAPIAGLHHLAPIATSAGAVVELHVRPGHAAWTASWTSPLLARARDARWAGGTVRVVAPDDLLAVLCEHVREGHRDDRRILPRHLGDLAVLTAAGASFDGAGALTGAGPCVAWSRALLEAARRGDRDVPRLVLERRRDRIRARLAVIAVIAAAERPFGGALRYVFPRRAFLSARYGVRRGSPLLPLLWAWRPLRGGWRVLTGR